MPNYQANSFANLSSDPTALAPSNENDYVRDREAATVLGKALFWDMQVGSDCVQACGSCHFTAGVDDRTKNQLNPNHLGGDNRLQIHGTGLGTQRNQTVTAEDFPFHELANPDIPGEPLLNPDNVVSDTNDVMSSMGVRFGVFRNIPIPGPTAFLLPSTIGGVRSLRPDIAGSRIDPLGNIFQNLRRVEPRNTPTIFAAAMNFDNFWDSRARHDFNGGSVFGASDPQSHVMANDGTVGGAISPTRQIIRFSSIASLATGPALSNFEMSFDGRNWAKLGKKLLQDGVTPLANQLVDTTDSVLGPYSNQWIIPGMPGLWITYPELIEEAFYPQLWANRSQHLNGAPDPNDPFDGFSLAVAAGPAGRANRNQFTQMEANMALFFGLGVQIWSEILIPDDTPFDQMLDQNPDAFLGLGEAGEPLLVWDLPTTGQGIPGPSFTEVGNFKRDPGIPATAVGPFPVGTPFVSTGTRVPSDPDPLLGLDIFMGSNVSLKNPNFRAARCGACHLGANLTDNNITRSHQAELGDFVAEFFQPGHEIPIEPLGRGRTITGFGLESELNGNAQDAVERFIVNQSVFIDSDPLSPTFGLSLPDGAAFIDNGNYNLGVTPIANDISHGGLDPFGWPLSLAALMLKNLGGVDQEPGTPLPNFDPALGIGGGLFEESAQDQFINPGIEEEPADPMLPPYLAPWASNIPVGDVHPQLDEATFVQVNTLTETPIIEGFIDTIGPFNPAGVINEAYNNAQGPAMGTYPVVNRVLKDGAFKAPQLRNVELTGPYFHNGGKLTLRQVVDFYARGGDFPITNGPHRDMMIIDLRNDIQALGFLNQLPGQTRPDLFTQEEALEALVDFMLELTDERVKFEKAPFDRPEMIIPIDGRAPGNIVRRERLLNLANATPPLFRDVPAVGAAGRTDPLPNFLGISSTPVAGPNNDHFDR